MKPEPTGLFPRKSKLFWTLVFTVCFVPWVATADPDGLQRPTWSRTAALQAAALPPNQQELPGWLQMIDAGNADQLLDTLQQSRSTGNQAGSPAFESQLFDLALALAEAPEDAAIDALLIWLVNYPSAVLVAHEENVDYGVPLYPVSAAAMGAVNERQRQQAQMRASQLLESSPQQWIERYLSSTSIEQQGFRHSLRVAPADALEPLAAALHQQLTQHPELAAPAGELASLLSDPQLFLAAYESAEGAISVNLLREANWRLDAAQRSQLLAGSLELDSTDKTALAISLLAPGLHSNPAISEKLLHMLDDPALGAAAALALAGHPDQEVQGRLQDLLQAGGLKGQRAGLALDQSALIQPDSDPQ